MLDAFNAGDMDCLRDMYDPDVVIGRVLEGWPETGPFVGRDAVMRQWERSREPWGNTGTLEPVSIIDAGDRVVARQIAHGVGRGPAFHAEFTTVHRGPETVKRYGLSWAEMMDATVEVRQVFEAGDQIVAWTRVESRGGLSGVLASQDLAFIFKLRDGLVTRVQETQDKRKALKAVGLAE